jgi:uncharacterized linocin/CFP29 family protein
MDDRSDQVGWSEAQWNRVRAEVLRSWQSVRVAGSFLPVYGPLPPSTQVVPSEIIRANGTVDERSVAPLLEISLPVTLSRQQAREDDLSSALLQFRRRAAQLGQLEDWYIFNGAYPYEPTAQAAQPYQPDYPFLGDLDAEDFLSGAPEPIADHQMQQQGLVMRNPGVLGLFDGARTVEQASGAGWATPSLAVNIIKPVDFVSLMDATVGALGQLEENGYVAPYVCAYGRDLFQAANRPFNASVVSVRDRLEPLIGREILHASALNVAPEGLPALARAWRSRGLLLSLSGDAVDLAIASEATPEFRFMNAQGRYVFSVFERFTLRIKDPRAIAPLR